MGITPFLACLTNTVWYHFLLCIKEHPIALLRPPFPRKYIIGFLPFNLTIIMAPQKTRHNTRKPRLFQCTGYGDCHMVFTRSEHLARHAR